eukprot:m.306011 g.306011  ORF g.306011 m.306011 type:complete len:189 (-) comp23019_c1_seq1:81-647(-)
MFRRWFPLFVSSPNRFILIPPHPRLMSSSARFAIRQLQSSILCPRHEAPLVPSSLQVQQMLAVGRQCLGSIDHQPPADATDEGAPALAALTPLWAAVDEQQVHWASFAVRGPWKTLQQDRPEKTLHYYWMYAGDTQCGGVLVDEDTELLLEDADGSLVVPAGSQHYATHLATQADVEELGDLLEQCRP